MTPADPEDRLGEQATIRRWAGLGWQAVTATAEILGVAEPALAR